MRDAMELTTYKLPIPGKPPEPPMLRKIALEEHFDHSAATPKSGLGDIHLTVQAPSGSVEPDWFKIVRQRLVDFAEKRLAGWTPAGSTRRSCR